MRRPRRTPSMDGFSGHVSYCATTLLLIWLKSHFRKKKFFHIAFLPKKEAITENEIELSKFSYFLFA
ncbi:hypothetical protein U27_05274 [Candidatus Vecturithrix granuli]|uniref:Uncharacterized protein n=1 Tax=Vecturithrix granuli TaxID=1499967 RepID=A0A081C145_VECG1|nr:hypothetical protein U27_05274 [Candidatus Vecturithrix granuli]